MGSGVTPTIFLHDGRADTLQEAIEWHGGEAQGSIDRWLMLSEDERSGILEFLEDLGATPNEQNLLNNSDLPPPVSVRKVVTSTVISN